MLRELLDDFHLAREQQRREVAAQVGTEIHLVCSPR
jgi:hypothetical protein